MSQDPKWARGFNDGMAAAVEEMLYQWEPVHAEALMHHVTVDELSREQVRRMRKLAQKHRAYGVLEKLRSAQADRRSDPNA